MPVSRKRNGTRRPRPENPPANTYLDSRPQPDMPQVRELLAFKRANKREPVDNMGAAMERAFCDHLGRPNIGKKAVLTRRQAFEARAARRGEKVAA